METLPSDTHRGFSTKITDNPVILLAIVMAGFFLSVFSLSPNSVDSMQVGDAFIFQTIPPTFWLGVVIIASAIFLMIKNLESKLQQVIFLISTVILVISFRMAFSITFTTIPAFEPDAANYMTIVDRWVSHGLDFGVEGLYQHNFPLSFLFGFIFVKLGFSTTTFFRYAPFFIYASTCIILYFIIKEVIPENTLKSNKLAFISAYLLSFASLGYWLAVHYCPDLFGALMFFLCLYLCIRFVKAEKWSIKWILTVISALFLLILSHHLSTLYLIFTLYGLTFSTWFFKPPQFKKGVIGFFVLATLTYTMWFAYGSLVYPSFFNVYVYFSGFSSIVTVSAAAGTSNNLLFAIYPLFILILSAIALYRDFGIKHPFTLFKSIFNRSTFRTKLKCFRNIGHSNILLVYAFGFILDFILFVLGFGIPSLFGTRILEVLCIGLYPLASETFLSLEESPSDKRRIMKIVLYVIIMIVIITGIYRYYTQTQRRVTVPIYLDNV